MLKVRGAIMGGGGGGGGYNDSKGPAQYAVQGAQKP